MALCCPITRRILVVVFLARIPLALGGGVPLVEHDAVDGEPVARLIEREQLLEPPGGLSRLGLKAEIGQVDDASVVDLAFLESVDTIERAERLLYRLGYHLGHVTRDGRATHDFRLLHSLLRLVLGDGVAPHVELHDLLWRRVEEAKRRERLLPLDHAGPSGLRRVHQRGPTIGHIRNTNLRADQSRLPVLGLDRVKLVLAVLLEAHKLRVAHLVDALDRAALDSLVDLFVVVAALLEDASATKVVLEHERVWRDEAAVRAANACHLVDKDKLCGQVLGADKL
mmetsp:Transcript_13074/g.34075  ORF Transcript_13074/g.34075 Transcript_13074/m.34075 type:complete len:283 (+) Transcript_13074:291-1139(+)